jgi:type I restriction enzyme S subunit
MTEDRSLPGGWTWATIGDLAADLRYGTSAKTSAEVGDMPVLRMGNLSSSGELLLDNLKYLPTHHPDIAQVTLISGDVLFNRTNSIELVGKSAVYRGQIAPCAFASYLIRVRLASACIPEYLVACLNSPLGKEWVRTVASQQVGQANINGSKLKEFGIPLPPLAEQRRIVSEIDSQFTMLRAAVGNLESCLQRLRVYRNAVLRAAFAGVAGGDSVPLGDLGDVVGGVTKGQNRSASSIVRSVPYLRVANVQRGYLDLHDVRLIDATDAEVERLALKPGDVLLNEGGDRDKLGRGWIWRGELPLCVHQNHVFRVRLKPGTALPEFISWYANSVGQQYFFQEGKHTTNLASISLTKLRAFPVPRLPVPAQQRVILELERRLSVSDSLARVLQMNARRAERLRQAILKRAIEGRLVAQDPRELCSRLGLLKRVSQAELGANVGHLASHTHLGSK